MKLNIEIKTKKERVFFPDISNNLSLDEEARFGIKVKKLSMSLHSDKWAKQIEDTEDGISINLKKYVRSHVDRIINPPVLLENGKEKELDIETLFSDDYEELYPVVEGLLSYISKMYDGETEEDVKK